MRIVYGAIGRGTRIRRYAPMSAPLLLRRCSTCTTEVSTRRQSWSSAPSARARDARREGEQRRRAERHGGEDPRQRRNAVTARRRHREAERDDGRADEVDPDPYAPAIAGVLREEAERPLADHHRDGVRGESRGCRSRKDPEMLHDDSLSELIVERGRGSAMTWEVTAGQIPRREISARSTASVSARSSRSPLDTK